MTVRPEIFIHIHPRLICVCRAQRQHVPRSLLHVVGVVAVAGSTIWPRCIQAYVPFIIWPQCLKPTRGMTRWGRRGSVWQSSAVQGWRGMLREVISGSRSRSAREMACGAGCVMERAIAGAVTDDCVYAWCGTGPACRSFLSAVRPPPLAAAPRRFRCWWRCSDVDQR